MGRTNRMKGKRALVTGSGTGIGRGIALEFAREGAVVAVHYSHSKKGAVSLIREIESEGGRAAAFKADFAEVEQVRRLAGRAIKFLGGLDVLVNNVGITLTFPFEEVTPEQFDLLYHVNVRAQFFLTQAVLPALTKSRGAVVNITSIHAFEGYPEHSVYAGTKGAIVAYTRELAIELALKGVRVNAVAPGAVPVENHYKADPNLDLKTFGRCIPCGFAGVPRDIARVVLFLASEEARYIVGQTLIVDGGTTSWLPFSDAFRQPITTRLGKGYAPGL